MPRRDAAWVWRWFMASGPHQMAHALPLRFGKFLAGRFGLSGDLPCGDSLPMQCKELAIGNRP